MKDQSKSKDRPRLAPWLLVIVYFVIISLTTFTCFAADPIQELMGLNGAFSHLSDESERRSAIKSVVGYGGSFCALSGLIVGPLVDFLGVRTTAVFGQISLGTGFLLLFFGSSELVLSIGSVLMGISYQAICISHLSVSILFPKNVGLVMSILGSGPDISLGVPTIMKAVAFYGGPEYVKPMILSFVIFACGSCALADFILTPSHPFELQEAEENSVSDIEKFDSVSETKPLLPETHTTNSYDGRPLMEQLFSSHFAIMIPFFILSFCRRKHFATNARGIFSEIAGGDAKTGDKWADILNIISPVQAVFAIWWGYVTDLWGVNWALVLMNVFGLGITAVPLVASIPFQCVSIFCIGMVQAYMFGIMFIFYAKVFGFTYLSTLQGVASAFVGSASLLMDVFWNDMITHRMGNSYWKVNAILTVIGLVMFIFPLYMWIWPPPAVVLETTFKDHEISRLYKVVPVVDRRSTTFLRQRCSKPSNPSQ